MLTFKNKALAGLACACERCGTLLPKAEVTPRRMDMLNDAGQIRGSLICYYCALS